MKLKKVTSVTKTYGTTQGTVEEDCYVVGEHGVKEIVWADPGDNNGLNVCYIYFENSMVFLSEPTRVGVEFKEE